MPWVPITLTVLAFAAAAMAVVGVYFILRDRLPSWRFGSSVRLHEDQFGRQEGTDPEGSLFKDLGKLAAEAAAEGQKLSLRQRFVAMVEQSGLALRPQALAAIMVGAGGVLAFVGALIIRILGNHLLIGAGLGLAIGIIAPLAFVQFKRVQRLEKMLSQLPDALDQIVSVMRVGRSMQHAMQEVADHTEEPLAGELNFCMAQQDLGLSPEAAFRDLSRRTGLQEVKILTLALLIQKQTGGNFIELLERLAGMIRERFRVRGHIKTLTAEGRLQANVLIAIPPLLFFAMLFLNREFASVLLEHPNLLIGMAVTMVVGIFWIRRIVNIDF